MSALKSILNGIVQGLISSRTNNQTPRPSQEAGRSGTSKPRLKPQKSEQTQKRQKPQKSQKSQKQSEKQATTESMDAGQIPDTETVLMDPRKMPNVRISYAPSKNGSADAGEVVWTWVPYEENDGRGKDRPVLVIGRQSADRVFAVRMTTKGSRNDLSIGSGAWDSQGRESWVDIGQLYSVHTGGVRREAAVLDKERYVAVASALIARYGWAVGDE